MRAEKTQASLALWQRRREGRERRVAGKTLGVLSKRGQREESSGENPWRTTTMAEKKRGQGEESSGENPWRGFEAGEMGAGGFRLWTRYYLTERERGTRIRVFRLRQIFSAPHHKHEI